MSIRNIFLYFNTSSSVQSHCCYLCRETSWTHFSRCFWLSFHSGQPFKSFVNAALFAPIFFPHELSAALLGTQQQADLLVFQSCSCLQVVDPSRRSLGDFHLCVGCGAWSCLRRCVHYQALSTAKYLSHWRQNIQK